MTRRIIYGIALLVLALGLSSCRNEAQNRIRRSVQDFAGQRMFITLYDQNGDPIFDGIVDGIVSRSLLYEATNRENEESLGSYIYWFDERGTYFQSDLQYLLTSHDRNVSDGSGIPSQE